MIKRTPDERSCFEMRGDGNHQYRLTTSPWEVVMYAKNVRAFVTATCIVAILLLLDVASARAQTTDEANKPATRKSNETELLRLFADTLLEIERSYVEEIDREELIEAAIEGMMSRLDQHSNYIPPEEILRFRGSIENEYGGIGVQVSLEKGVITVISPFYGSPAYERGIMAGDTILSIEGKSTEGMTLEEAVELTTGKIGTPVRISVRHRHSQQVEEIVLERALVKMETVLGDRRNKDDQWVYFVADEPKIAYVRLTGFGRTTAEELTQVLLALEREGMQGLILDLRFNPGGLLTSAIEISDMFLSEGKIVSTEGRSTIPREWSATRETILPSTPVCVLVNQYSASASEIVSACLKDNRRATVIGERTFGKGSVQNVIPLEDGDRALKLTTATYYRPNGKNIHRHEGASEDQEWGVQPDEGFEFKFTDDQWASYLLARRARDAISSREQVLNHPPKEVQPTITATSKDERRSATPQDPSKAGLKDGQGDPDAIQPMLLPAQDRHFIAALEHLRRLLK